MMDLNQLLYNHQLALMAQHEAQSIPEYEGNVDLVELHAERIRQYRADEGLARYPVTDEPCDLASFEQ